MNRRNAHEIPCPQCGYDLRGTRFDNCPECGCDVHSKWRKQRRAERKRVHRGENTAGIITIWVAILAVAALFATLAVILVVLRSVGFPIMTVAP